MKYIVIEMQTFADGNVGVLVHKDGLNDSNVAESKYHEVLHYAAVSTLPKHAAIIVTEEGKLRKQECYTHEQEEPLVEM